MFDKVISGVYENKLYNKDDVRDSIMCYNYHIFDIIRGCTFICSRVTDNSRPFEGSLYDIMSADDISEAVRYLETYTETPLFVSTSKGIALMLPHITPCSTLGILLFPHFDGKYLLRIYKHNKWSFKLARCLSDTVTVYSKNCVKYAPLAEIIYTRISRAFDWTVSSFSLDMCGDITAYLEDRIYALSYFAGCPAGIFCKFPVESIGDYDFPMFTVFILIMASVVARECPDRQFSVALLRAGLEPLVRVDFIANGHTMRNDCSILGFKAVAYRKNMHFSVAQDNNMVYIKFYPSIKDWSILGIKSPAAEDLSEYDIQI